MIKYILAVTVIISVLYSCYDPEEPHIDINPIYPAHVHLWFASGKSYENIHRKYKF